MKDYEFHPEALDEMRKAGRFYDERRIGLGDNLLDRIQETIDRLRSGYSGGSPWIHKTRLQSVSRFSYGIVYREYSDRISIIAVYHFSRRKDYWVHRLDGLDEE